MKQNISFLGQGSENNCVIRPEQLSSPTTLLVECCLGRSHPMWTSVMVWESALQFICKKEPCQSLQNLESALQFIFKSLARFFTTCFHMSHHYGGNLASTQVLESLLQNNGGWPKNIWCISMHLCDQGLVLFHNTLLT